MTNLLKTMSLFPKCQKYVKTTQINVRTTEIDVRSAENDVKSVESCFKIHAIHGKTHTKIC